MQITEPGFYETAQRIIKKDKILSDSIIGNIKTKELKRTPAFIARRLKGEKK